MANLPRQVAAQAERANQLHAELYSTPTEETPPEQQPQENTEAEERQEPVQEAPPTTESQPNPEPATPAEEPQTHTREYWENRFNTLQGVHRSDSARWQAEKRALEDRIRALEQAQAKPPEPPPTSAQEEVRRLITDQDRETYGPELLDVIARAAAEQADKIVAERMKELQPEIEKTREQVSNVTQQVYRSNEEKFFGELAKEVPDWQQVNSDERWLQWLGEVDPLSGVPRQRYLDHAQQSLDHVRVANLFNAFKTAAGIGAPANDPAPPAQTSSAPALSPTPRTVGNATAPTPREPQTGVSRSEVDAHYRRASTDARYRGSDEYRAFEQRLATAMATGAISP